MPNGGCCVLAMIRRSAPSFARFALAPLTQLHLVKVLVKLLDDPALCILLQHLRFSSILGPSFI